MKIRMTVVDGELIYQLNNIKEKELNLLRRGLYTMYDYANFATIEQDHECESLIKKINTILPTSFGNNR